ncbi:MAG: gamma-glutamylcyclotransferase [Tatlockia sp.]|nr:gamma-glutamylcyclotransferase [Tatlockia sp.]
MTSSVKKFIVCFLGVVTIYKINWASPSCHPKINNDLPQYVIGYGTLMQESSKREDDAKAGDNYPIYLKGYERGWIEKGRPIGFSITYLGVRKKANGRINAVYYQTNNIFSYDKREGGYCRQSVSTKSIQFLEKKLSDKSQFWIYVPEKESDIKVSSKYPIVQSYVDIFLSGCFELEKKYHLKNFAKECVKTTTNWSSYWVNDRIYPRTAADYHPVIYDIDLLLSKELPEHFKNIRME